MKKISCANPIYTSERMERSLNIGMLKMHMGASTNEQHGRAYCKEISIKDVHLCSLEVFLLVARSSEHFGAVIIRHLMRKFKVHLLYCLRQASVDNLSVALIYLASGCNHLTNYGFNSFSMGFSCHFLDRIRIETTLDVNSGSKLLVYRLQ